MYFLSVVCLPLAFVIWHKHSSDHDTVSQVVMDNSMLILYKQHHMKLCPWVLLNRDSACILYEQHHMNLDPWVLNWDLACIFQEWLFVIWILLQSNWGGTETVPWFNASSNRQLRQVINGMVLKCEWLHHRHSWSDK